MAAADPGGKQQAGTTAQYTPSHHHPSISPSLPAAASPLLADHQCMKEQPRVATIDTGTQPDTSKTTSKITE